MNEDNEIINNLKFRWSNNFDKKEIKELLIKNFGTFPIEEGALKPIKNRYYLAFYNNKLIAMSGLTSNSHYYGLEISWTCTDQKYRKLGIMKKLIGQMIQNVNKPIYCEYWHWQNKENINLYYPLSQNGFKQCKKQIIAYDNNFMKRCQNCINYNKQNCCCTVDLWEHEK